MQGLCTGGEFYICLISFQQFLQQQMVGAGPVGGAFSSASGLGMGSLLSPTSPTYPLGGSPLSSSASPGATGLQTPSGTPGTIPAIPSLTNGLQTLSPNGLTSTSTDPLQSPLHR